MNLNFNEVIAKANIATVKNDNVAAAASIRTLMENGEKLTITFRTAKNNGVDYAWVESPKCSGIRLDATEKSVMWLFLYIFSGNTDSAIDFDPEKMEVKPREEGEQSAQIVVMKMLVNAGKAIKMLPSYKNPDGMILGTYSAKKGKILFRIESTQEIVDYLTEKKQIA